MIRELYIKNFRNIEELTIEPSQFINLIEGDNGQGKSSILQAIKYILTDDLDEKISEYVRWGQDKFILKCKFMINNIIYDYSIEGSKSSKKELIINGQDIYKNSEATKKMNEIIDANIIRYSVIAEQGKNTQILFDKPTERLKHLKEILGIDKLFPIVEEMKEDEKIKVVQVGTNMSEIKLLQERQYNFIEVPIVNDIEDIKNKFSLIEKEKEIFELQYKLYEKYIIAFDKFKEAQNKILEINFQLEQNHLNLNQKKLEFKKIKSEKSIDELQNILIDYEKQKIEQKNIIDNSNKIKRRIIECEKNISIETEKLDKYKLRRISQCLYETKDIEEIEILLTNAKISLADYQKQLKLAEQGKCPTCGKEFIIDIVTIQNLLSDCTENIKQYEQRKKEISIEFERFNKEFNDQELIKVQKKNIEFNIDNLKKELDKLQLENCVEINDIYNYDSQIAKIQIEINELKDIEKHNNIIQKEIDTIQNKIETFKHLIKQYEIIEEPDKINKPNEYDKSLYDLLNKEIIVHDQKLKEKEKAEIYNENVQKEKNKNEERIKILESDINSLSYEIEILKESKQILDKEFSAYLIDKGALFIKENMNSFFQKAYGKYEITFQQDKNSIDFFYGDGETISPVGMSSGYEKALLALSFRIALSFLNPIGIFIMDEVDSDSSSSNSLALYQTLLDVVDNDIQLWAITHLDETKELLLQRRGSKAFEMREGKVLN